MIRIGVYVHISDEYRGICLHGRCVLVVKITVHDVAVRVVALAVLYIAVIDAVVIVARMILNAYKVYPVHPVAREFVIKVRIGCSSRRAVKLPHIVPCRAPVVRV